MYNNKVGGGDAFISPKPHIILPFAVIPHL